MKAAAKHVMALLAIFLLLTAFKTRQQANEWIYEREKKGIKVFTKKSKWGHFRDSKATMVVSTSVADMEKMLTDFDNYSNWIPRCKAARVVARLSDNEFITHMTFNSPWPVADRDCVMRIKVTRDAKGVVTITQTSEPKYLKESEGVVRIQQMTGLWKLIPVANGTEVINEYSTNPGGNIPDWLTNTQSVEAPMETFESLKEHVTVKK
ncbi:MAG: hypothetical protein IPH78_03125 [Bacteroidetes bacterium]|nr:hypothetical protein [Bacteroidota bacterium]MBK8657605.1 hypothetical protein [Bacteroidota bacterium]